MRTLAKTYLKIIFAVSVIFASFIACKGVIFFNLTPSLPYGLWMHDNQPLHLGSYVVFCPTLSQLEKFREYKKNTGVCEGGYKPMLKKVSKMNEDKYFVTGEHPQSYDSRIFGNIEEKQIITTVKPVITWKG